MVQLGLKKVMKAFCLIAFGALYGTNGIAQRAVSQEDEQVHTFITGRYHYGLVIPHHSTMMYFIDDYSRGAEVTFGRRAYGKDNWEKYFNYPEIGLGLFYATHGNVEIYGEGVALFPYINYKLIHTPRFTMQNKLAMGLGYVTKPYSLVSNNYNMVFGSRLNVYIGMSLLLDIRMTDNLSFATGVSLNHMSNGAVKKPNHGINLLSASAGFKYHFNKALNPPVRDISAPDSNEREFFVIGSVGRSQGASFYPDFFWNGSVSLNHLWHTSKLRAWGVGADCIYYSAAPHVFDEEGKIGGDFSSKDYFFTGIFGSYNVFLGKTTLFGNIGAYLTYKIKPPQPVYSRLGVRYRVTQQLMANFSIKASFFRSEFLEFGVGYRWNYKKNTK